jgi:hypothetical protein
MKALLKRRLSLTTATVAASGILVWTWFQWADRLPYMPFISGWLLFLVILFLAFYNVFKKLPFLPLGSSKVWLQAHIYLGLLSAVMFAAHLSFRMPTGQFEIILACLYVAVALTGVLGLLLTRWLPVRLTSRGGQVIYERIPRLRKEIEQSAETTAMSSISETRAATIAEFYARELKSFFAAPRNLLAHALGVSSPLNRLHASIDNQKRYLSESERRILDQLDDLVRRKDNLDFQASLQFALKAWLFTHIPLTYSLLIFSVTHIVLVYAFSSGAP